MNSNTEDIQQKRFEKELKLLNNLVGVKTYPRQTPFGVIVRIVYQPGVLCSSEIIFDLYLEGKYPFQPPKLVCESVLGFPSYSDGRDLIFEVIKSKWTPSITSADIIGIIPNFFQSYLQPLSSSLSSKDFGKFHLSSPYYLESWERKDSMGSFYCTDSTSKELKEKMLILTHTAILILDLNPQFPGIGYLVSWATLQSLNNIRRSIKESNKLTLEWKKIGDNPAYSQKLTFANPSEFIELLSRNMQKNGAVVRRLTANKLFKEDEVNGKAIKAMNIEEILQAIEVYEDNFESSINPGMVNTLLELYQRAIEYFAAIGSGNYSIFLKRMHLILSNENVVSVMQGKSSVVKEEDNKVREEEKANEEEKVKEVKKVVKMEKFEVKEEKKEVKIEVKEEKIEVKEEKIEVKVEKTDKNEEFYSKNDMNFASEIELSETTHKILNDTDPEPHFPIISEQHSNEPEKQIPPPESAKKDLAEVPSPSIPQQILPEEEKSQTDDQHPDDSSPTKLV